MPAGPPAAHPHPSSRSRFSAASSCDTRALAGALRGPAPSYRASSRQHQCLRHSAAPPRCTGTSGRCGSSGRNIGSSSWSGSRRPAQPLPLATARPAVQRSSAAVGILQTAQPQLAGARGSRVAGRGCPGCQLHRSPAGKLLLGQFCGVAAAAGLQMAPALGMLGSSCLLLAAAGQRLGPWVCS